MSNPCEKCHRKPNCPKVCYPLKDYRKSRKGRKRRLANEWLPMQVLRWALNQLEGHNYIVDGYGTVAPSAKVDAFSMAIYALAMQGDPVRHGLWIVEKAGNMQKLYVAFAEQE